MENNSVLSGVDALPTEGGVCSRVSGRLLYTTEPIFSDELDLQPYPNPSGIIPLDLRVLVRVDPPESVTAGGIIIPDSTKEMQKSAAVKGTMIAIGGNAFREAEASGWCKCPEPGERVMIEKYGGVVVKGKDGEEYRLLNDEAVVATLEAEK